MDKQYFNCPDCGAPIGFDDWDDIFDTMADTLSGKYIEYAAYTCPNCGAGDLVAKVHYTLKFEKVEIE